MKIKSIRNDYYKIKNFTPNYKKTNFGQNILDSHTANSQKEDNFSKKEAAKNFAKGIFSPIKAVIEHPIISLGTVAITGIACSLVPILTPITAIGFGALSVFQLGKGITTSAIEYKKGNYDKSEKAFELIGQGTVGTATALISVKQNAKIIKESAYMNKLERTSLSYRERTHISKNTNGMSIGEYFDLYTSLFFTKEGRQIISTQFKPFMIKQRAKELIGLLNPKNKKTDIIKSYDEKKYIKTPEGKRRAKISDTEIEQQTRIVFDKVFDEAGIPQEYRPALVTKKLDNAMGGAYDRSKHSILYNTNSYRNGLTDIEEVIKHESIHCQKALLRAGLSQCDVDTIVKSVLKGKILNGDAESVLLKSTSLGMEMTKPPLMNTQMKLDFLQVADDNLFVPHSPFIEQLMEYQHQHSLQISKNGFFNPTKLENAKTSISPFLDKLNSILKKNPDFIAQYQNYDEALNSLLRYSISHNQRYNRFRNTQVGNGVNIPLTSAQTENAKRALVDFCETMDGTWAVSKSFATFLDKPAFNQYQFSPEEVTAHTTANNYLAKTLTEKLNSLKNSGNLTPEHETYLNNQIEKALFTVEHRTKGLEYHKNHTRLINNPKNDGLRATVEKQGAEVESLAQKINQLRPQYSEKPVSYFDKAPSAKPLNLAISVLNQIKKKEN